MKSMLSIAVLSLFLIFCHSAPGADTETNPRGRILDARGVVLAETVEDGQRKYPLANETSHLTGYLGQKITVGLFGLEKTFNESLTQGNDLTLTIDTRMQRLAHESFPEDKNGAIVVIDPHTGAILAMASFPGFDPNDFVPAISQEKLMAYTKDPRRPLFNRAIHPYVPGSVSKIPAALAAGMAGLADKSYSCEGSVPFGDLFLKCWISRRPEGKHGILDPSEAVKFSCNAWFYQLSNEAGIEPFEKTAQMLGLYDSTNCGLPHEGSGISPSQHFNSRGMTMSGGDRAMVSIGQGTVQATPLQMASVAATLANGGKRFQPHLVQQKEPELLKDLTQSGISADHIEVVRKAMWRVVNDEDGSASHLHSDDIEIAGKTGTAQTGKPDRPFHAWFMGFAPYKNPQLAVCVFVENGNSGSHDAGPIAREILTRGQALLKE